MLPVERVTLSDERVRLEPLELRHEAGLRRAAADGELWRIRVTSVPEPEDTRGYIERALQSFAEGHRLAFAVLDAGTGEVRTLFEERMRDVKPGITGLAQISLGYTGSIPEGSEIGKLASTLQNPWDLEETKGSLADDMRIKLLYDLAYTASLERFDTFLRTELGIIFKTPLVMLKMTQGR